MSQKEIFKDKKWPGGASFDCYAGETILEASKNSRLPLASNCQQGECGTCKVRIRKGQIKLAPFMLSALSMQDIEADYTLACRSYPLTDLEVLAELPFMPMARHYKRRDKKD